MRRSWRVVAFRGREGASAISRRREAGRFSGGERGRCGGVLHNGFRGKGGEKRAVKHGKSGLRAAICALFGTSLHRQTFRKTVEKLCKSLQGVKTKITNCAQRFVRLCVMVRELCKYRFRAAFGVWALWCGGAPFGRFPSRLRRRGAHLGGGGAAVGRQRRGERTGRGGLLCKGASAFAFALPHPAHGASPISGRGRGRRQAAAGRTHGQGRGLPGALSPLRTAVRPSAGGAQR